jgi:hypothetical protein
MKYIITENQLEDGVIYYLNEMYGDLEEYRTDEYPHKVFYMKGDNLYMEHNLKNGRLWVDTDTIWTDLKTIFSLENPEIQNVITKWVEETYKIQGVTPIAMLIGFTDLVEETYKLK